jgi:recombination protein RecR
MAPKYPSALLPIIAHLKKLPGVGTRTAERFAFELLSWPQEELSSFGTTTAAIREKIPPCATCGCLTDAGVCSFCDEKRVQTQLCIVSSSREVFSIEATGSYKGLYHVIEHLLSPMDHRHASGINLRKIEERIAERNIEELILAFDSTLEGDTTALYLKNHFANLPLSISRLAFGIPVGSSLEYIDGGTLGRALSGRQTF